MLTLNNKFILPMKQADYKVSQIIWTPIYFLAPVAFRNLLTILPPSLPKNHGSKEKFLDYSTSN